MTLTIEDLPEVDFWSPEFAADPNLAVASARDSVGLARSRRGVEVLSYGAVTDILRDDRFGAGLTNRLASIGIFDGPVFDILTNLISDMTGAEHNRVRLAVAPWFKTSTAEAIRSRSRDWVDSWIDEHMDSGHFDFSEVVSRPLPTALFLQMVGGSQADRDRITEITAAVNLIATDPPPELRGEIERGTLALIAYVRELTEQKRREPDDGLLTALIEANTAGKITEDEILNLIWVVLNASTDSTSAQMCSNLVALAEQPEQWQLLKRQPELIPNAVLELTRFRPSLMGLGVKRVPEAVEFHGVEITHDTDVWINWFAASKDPRAYEDPTRLDVSRKLTQPTLAFGMGTHSCLGRVFALVEMEEVLKSLLAHWDEFSVDAAYLGFPVLMVPKYCNVTFTSAAA